MNFYVGGVAEYLETNPASNLRCPMCGKEIFASPKVYGCKFCAFRIWPQIAGKTLTANQIASLLTTGKTSVISIDMGTSEQCADVDRKYVGDVGFSITRGAVVVGKKRDSD